MVTLAICGCGSRGLYAYAQYQKLFPDELKVVAGADIKPERLELLREMYDVPEEMCFNSDMEMLEKPRLADAMLISTQDKQHVEEAILALEKGYHLICEKPISPVLSECLRLLDKVVETERFVAVGHVLRYSKFYYEIKQLIDQGVLGKLQTITMTENVGYWHQAHSFVRGNWRREDETSPMILAKSCHDMDLLRWFAGGKCLRVQSFGSLDFFHSGNAPEGAAKRCTQCKYKETCEFSAEKIYITNKKTGVLHNDDKWPANILAENPTEEKIRKAIEEGPYGRCVFYCDNDVVDHQVVNMEFENHVYGSFTMSAFTEDCYRTIKITGTKGEVKGNLDEMTLKLSVFGKDDEMIDLRTAKEEFAGHGGGDAGLAKDFVHLVANNGGEQRTSVQESVESHVMALAAEKSRKENGRMIEIEEFVKS